MGVSNKKLAIQITDSAINILIGNKNKIFESISIELDNGIYSNGNILDIDRLIHKLNEYLEVNARDVKDVSFVLAGSDIITRYIEVPILKDDALRQAVHFEFSQFIPEIDDYYMDYEIVEKINTKEKKVYKIVLVATSKEKVNEFVKIADKIGKNLDVIDTLSNSLSRNLRGSNYLVTEESTGIIYLDEDSSILSIIEDKALKFEKNLSYGINNIFDEAYDEVAATTVDNILDYSQESKISFEALLSNINNIIRFYNSDRSNRSISNLVIISVDNTIEGIERYFEKYFELPCVAVNQPSDLNLKVKFDEKFTTFIPCYGLLLRGNEKKLLNLNPRAINKDENKENLDRLLIRATLLVVCMMAVASIPFFVMNKVINKDIVGLEAEVAKYSEIVEKNIELKANNTMVESFISRIEGVEDNTAKTSTIISKLNSYVPKEITFNSMSFSDSGSISISGESTTYYSIPEFLANLQMSDEFSNAKISNITPIEKIIVTTNARNIDFSSNNKVTTTTNVEEDSRKIIEKNTGSSVGKGLNGVHITSSGSSSSNEQSTSGTNGAENSSNSDTTLSYSFSISIEGVSKDGTGVK